MQIEYHLIEVEELKQTINYYEEQLRENEIKYRENEEKLSDLLKSNGYEPIGSFLVAQYNSPWAIPPFRKNEIIVEIN